MRIKSYLQSKTNADIKAASSWEAMAMAQADPTNADLRFWVEVVEIVDDE